MGYALDLLESYKCTAAAASYLFFLGCCCVSKVNLFLSNTNVMCLYVVIYVNSLVGSVMDGYLREMLWLRLLNKIFQISFLGYPDPNPGHGVTLHPRRVKIYQIGCVGSGLVLAKALT